MSLITPEQLANFLETLDPISADNTLDIFKFLNKALHFVSDLRGGKNINMSLLPYVKELMNKTVDELYPPIVNNVGATVPDPRKLLNKGMLAAFFSEAQKVTGKPLGVGLTFSYAYPTTASIDVQRTVRMELMDSLAPFTNPV